MTRRDKENENLLLNRAERDEAEGGSAALRVESTHETDSASSISVSRPAIWTEPARRGVCAHWAVDVSLYVCAIFDIKPPARS